LTNVTTTTAYVRGNSSTGQQFVQSNGETGNPLLVNGSSNHPQPQIPFIEDYKTGQSNKNMEFLETVTNGFGSDRSEQIDNNMRNNTPKDPPPSRVPQAYVQTQFLYSASADLKFVWQALLVYQVKLLIFLQ
jgi:hypothetical protein